MYLAHTCAGDAHRQEAYPSRPKTLIHPNSKLAPSATLLPNKGANYKDERDETKEHPNQDRNTEGTKTEKADPATRDLGAYELYSNGRTKDKT